MNILIEAKRLKRTLTEEAKRASKMPSDKRTSGTDFQLMVRTL